MQSIKHAVLATVLASLSLAAQATSVTLAADGQWQAFGVDDQASLSQGTEWIDNNYSNSAGYGTPLSFSFTVDAGFQGTLTVVDADLAGDTFKVFNQGALLGNTSAVPAAQYGSTPDVGNDYDAALADPSFSRGVFTLGAGSYVITGALLQSVSLGASPLNATGGAVKLSVSAVPEPSSAALVLAALGITWLLSRRTSAR